MIFLTKNAYAQCIFFNENNDNMKKNQRELDFNKEKKGGGDLILRIDFYKFKNIMFINAFKHNDLLNHKNFNLKFLYLLNLGLEYLFCYIHTVNILAQYV